MGFELSLNVGFYYDCALIVILTQLCPLCGTIKDCSMLLGCCAFVSIHYFCVLIHRIHLWKAEIPVIYGNQRFNH